MFTLIVLMESGKETIIGYKKPPATAKPSDGKKYYWNEGTTSWVEIE